MGPLCSHLSFIIFGIPVVITRIQDHWFIDTVSIGTLNLVANSGIYCSEWDLCEKTEKYLKKHPHLTKNLYRSPFGCIWLTFPQKLLDLYRIRGYSKNLKNGAKGKK